MKNFSYLLALAGLIAGCSGNTGAVPTVADYLHDIDAAKTMAETAQKDMAKYATDPAAINAWQALSQRDGLLNCWPQMKGISHVVTTATTDHACLDSKGYKR